MGEIHENTNLASEFYILSMLYRKGLNASLTLGNKKSVDIMVIKNGKVLTIDVKGIKKSSSAFPIENCLIAKDHFIVFVAYKDISNLTLLEGNPDVYIVPSMDLVKKFKEFDNFKSCPGDFIYINPKGNRKTVDLNRLCKLKDKYANNWELIK